LSGLTIPQGLQLLQDLQVEGDASDLQEFVELTEGHPLLLTLAARSLLLEAKENLDSPEINRLGKDEVALFREIKGRHRDREATIGALLDRTLSKLPEHLQAGLRRLSVVRLETWGLELAQAMQPEMTLDDLRRAARLALVTETKMDGELRFGFLPLIRRYLGLVLKEWKELELAHSRAISYFDANIRPEFTRTLQDCQEELEIFYHFCELRDYDSALDSMKSINDSLALWGYYQVLIDCHERLIKSWVRNDTNSVQISYCYTVLGDAYQSLSQYEQALKYHYQALDIQITLDDQSGIAGSSCNIGSVLDSLEQYEEAISWHEEALARLHDVDNQEFEATVLCNLGNSYHSLYDHEKALEYYLKALDIQIELEDANGVGGVICNIGYVHASLGEYEEAVSNYEQALVLIRQGGNRKFEANTLGNLGNAHYHLKNYKQALEFQQQALTISQQIGNRSGEAAWALNVADTLATLQKKPLAIAHYQTSLDIYKELQLTQMVQQCQEQLDACQYRRVPRWLWFIVGLAIVLLIWWLKR
jgi:tetratricopeptide (TPR) repeat protein